MSTLVPTFETPVNRLERRPAECIETHTRLLKVALEVPHARSFWHEHRAGRTLKQETELAFAQHWFGARSYASVANLLLNFWHRFVSFPEAVPALAGFETLDFSTSTLICHWHLQLSDPIYRRFTGEFIPKRRLGVRPELTRDVVVDWVASLDSLEALGQGHRWTRATHVQFASKLLSSAHGAGLVATKRDPRPLLWPPVSDWALGYLFYLLREVDFEGTLRDNPYLRSVGLCGEDGEPRFRRLPGIRYARLGGLSEFEWDFPDLSAWVQGVK